MPGGGNTGPGGGVASGTDEHLDAYSQVVSSVAAELTATD